MMLLPPLAGPPSELVACLPLPSFILHLAISFTGLPSGPLRTRHAPRPVNPPAMTSALPCPLPGCPFVGSGQRPRRSLCAHLRNSQDPLHVALRAEPVLSPAHPLLADLGIALCPTPGCGHFYSSARLALHTRACPCPLSARPGSGPPSSSLDGTAPAPPGGAPLFMPASAAGVYRARERSTGLSTSDPSHAAVRWCLRHPGRVQAALRDRHHRTTIISHKEASSELLDAEISLWEAASSTRGAALAAATWEACLAFPVCLFFPHARGAPSSVVLSEVRRRLRLWRAGDLDTLFSDAHTASSVGSGAQFAPRPGQARTPLEWQYDRAAQLTRVGRFRDAAALTASHESLAALQSLFPAPSDDPCPGLLPPAPEPSSRPVPEISVDTLRTVLGRTPRRSAAHRDGWRYEHLARLTADDRGAAALASALTRIARADVPESVRPFLTSSTLIALMKKDPDTVARMRSEPGFRLPVRPIGYGSVLVRLASICLLHDLRDVLEDAVGPHQFAVGTRGGTDMIQWIIQAALEVRIPHPLAAFNLDASNAFNSVSRAAIRTSLLSNPSLHPLLPLYDLLYSAPSECWWYDPRSPDAPYGVLQCTRGVRQGDPLGMLLFCLATAPVYSQLAAALGPSAVLTAYADDVYCAGPPERVAAALLLAEPLYSRVGLSVGWGPGKTELYLPPSVPGIPLPLHPDGSLKPLLVRGFASCLGVPRHPTQDPAFLRPAFASVAARQSRLLAFISGVSVRHPKAAGRLLEVCAVRRFAHVLRSVPPDACGPFYEAQDTAVLDTFRTICGAPDSDHRPYCSVRLPTLLGGAGLSSLAHHAPALHLGGYYAIAGPLSQRLQRLPHPVLCSVLRLVLANPADPASQLFPWAQSLLLASDAVSELMASFQPWELDLADKVAPTGPTVAMAGSLHPSPRPNPPRLALDFLPDLHEAPASATGLHKLSHRLSHLVSWRSFFDLYKSAPVSERIRLLSHSGRGSVAFLTADTPRGYVAHPDVHRASVRRAVGLATLGSAALSVEDSCPTCGLHPDHDHALERHVPRCPMGAARHSQHAGLARMLRSIFLECGAKKDDVKFELQGLRSDRSRPGDVVWLGFSGSGRHLVVDGSIVAVFTNSTARASAETPGHAAACKEAEKLSADASSPSPVMPRHRLVPAVMEEGGRLGAHFLALLRELAERGVSLGSLLAPPSWPAVPPAAVVAYWVRLWTQRLSTWLHDTLSCRLLRAVYPSDLY